MRIAGVPIACECCGREFTPRRPKGTTIDDAPAKVNWVCPHCGHDHRWGAERLKVHRVKRSERH